MARNWARHSTGRYPVCIPKVAILPNEAHLPRGKPRPRLARVGWKAPEKFDGRKPLIASIPERFRKIGLP